ncbi:unnamed protein product [Vitrella brassicaformis CCMP3155]|uniref:Diphthine--ammonia ligase n=2 Tax=Vitrella brassicaformis TaxID=1169539 RepID=A0A0G4EJ41_VITBC|nr:unnamed protein product [Vitrella brassicaformis CCMP3155]|eukprot:CEL96052.1 unnamed protein product [Vitrella brassicaformis CCMP3155]
MKVVGLISGGKDSIFNLHCCVAMGHDLVALAHLKPPHHTLESDSWMYQSVGAEVVEAIATCIDRPLIQRTITGVPRATGTLGYDVTAGDEVEDLRLLLQSVKDAYPDVCGVACGAILSDYQRLRVEHVCGRLGLCVLALLWKQPQVALLDQMIACGMEAVLVKTASMGLKRAHLGRTIADLRPHFHQLHGAFGFHVCGEGGEYETITTDCPLYKKRLVIDASETVTHTDDGIAPVLLLHVTKWHLEDKTPSPSPLAAPMQPFISLERYLTDASFQRAAIRRADVADNGDALTRTQSMAAREATWREHQGLVWTSELDVSSLPSMDGEDGLSPVADEEEAVTQSRRLFTRLKAWLSREGLSLQDAVHVALQVSELSLFTRINAIYAGLFPSSPPARYCIQTHLPAGTHIRARLLMHRGGGGHMRRRHLHVQSISTWAAACIGPYSQGVAVGRGRGAEGEGQCGGGVAWLSGVIGLIPHAMKRPEEADVQSCSSLLYPAPTQQPLSYFLPAEVEVALALRSVRNVLTEMRTSLLHLVSLLVFTSDPAIDFDALEAMLRRLMAANRMPASSEGDKRPSRPYVGGSRILGKDESDYIEEEKGRDRYGDVVERPSSPPVAVTLVFARVPALPRGCSVELAPVAAVPLAAMALQHRTGRIEWEGWEMGVTATWDYGRLMAIAISLGVSRARPRPDAEGDDLPLAVRASMWVLRQLVVGVGGVSVDSLTAVDVLCAPCCELDRDGVCACWEGEGGLSAIDSLEASYKVCMGVKVVDEAGTIGSCPAILVVPVCRLDGGADMVIMCHAVHGMEGRLNE